MKEKILASLGVLTAASAFNQNYGTSPRESRILAAHSFEMNAHGANAAIRLAHRTATNLGVPATAPGCGLLLCDDCDLLIGHQKGSFLNPR